MRHSYHAWVSAQPKAAEKEVSNIQAEMHRPDIPDPKPMANYVDGYVPISIRYEDIRPGVVNDPVTIKVEDYAGLCN